MNLQELEKRNKTLEKRWKIMAAVAIIFLISRPAALYIVKNFIHKAEQEAAIGAKNNPYPLIDPARQLISQDKFVTNIQPLREYLKKLVADINPDDISIYYEQLNSGANIGINNDSRIYPASLAKLPIAIAAVKKIERGQWNWDTKFEVGQVDLDQGSGELYKTTPGTFLSFEQILKALLIDSDNTSLKILLRNMSKEEDFEQFESQIGLENLFDDQGKASAKELSRIFRVLYTSSYLERADSQKILELLTEASFKEYLSQGIPNDIKFAHKYGENTQENAFIDSGVVYSDGKPYILTVMIRTKDSSEESIQWVKKMMKDISEHSYKAGLSK